MSKNKNALDKSGSSTSVAEFLEKVDQLPARNADGSRAGRLIFAMDATASRAPTWDMACQLQGDMFKKTKKIGELHLQLVFFRGYQECKSSPWLTSSDKLVRLMSSVQCQAGRTQIERVLKHVLTEARRGEVDALVYVGDSMEEDVDKLGALAGQLKLYQLPMLIFQEGNNPTATYAFKQFAQLSGGAHCQLDYNSASQLGELLNAAAVYAAGGKKALDEFARLAGGQSRNLLQQLK